MVRFVYGIFPAFIKVGALPEGVYGRTLAMFVTMPEGYNEGQLAHEMTHVWQGYRTFFLHPILNSISKTYRLMCEFEALRVQLMYPGYTAGGMAIDAARAYGMTEDEAFRRLTE